VWTDSTSYTLPDLSVIGVEYVQGQTVQLDVTQYGGLSSVAGLLDPSGPVLPYIPGYFVRESKEITVTAE
jgi:hypothetical protein